MIIPIKYLWEQLDGPQVTAFTTAIFEYMKSIFDDKLEYFNNISIKTANNQHLTLLGLLSGLVRPTVSEADKNYFYFSEEPEHPVEHGFSALTNRARGGRFVGIGVGQGTHNVSLNEAHYRALLEAWLESDGELGSLELLDTICYKLSQLDLGDDVTPFYTFEFMSGDNVPAGRAPGDVFIDMGTMSQWNNPLHVYAVLRGIANSIYAPQPQIFVSIGTEDMVITPEASPKPEDYTSETEVVLSTPTVGATIYYTTDGSVPTTDSLVYTAPIPIPTEAGTWKLRAMATAPGYGNSLVATFEYTIS